MHKWIFFLLLIPITGTAAAQEKNLPAEATSFLLPGYSMLDYITGDLNNDKKPDAILVMRQNGEDSVVEDLLRPMVILIRNNNGKLEQVKRNDSAILCYHCGGIYGDPYESIEIKNGVFTISVYGGSSWRWGNTYTFTYHAEKNNWYLTHEYGTNYHNTEMEATEKQVNIDKEELGEIAFNTFNGSPSYTESKWMVTAAKTFFYNNPKLGAKPRKGYLIKGDIVSVYREFKNFVQVNFENKKSQYSTGFVLKKDLERVK